MGAIAFPEGGEIDKSDFKLTLLPYYITFLRVLLLKAGAGLERLDCQGINATYCDGLRLTCDA